MGWAEPATLGLYKIFNKLGEELARVSGIRFGAGLKLTTGDGYYTVSSESWALKEPCTVASSTNLTLSNAVTSINGIALTDGMRVCVWKQTDTTQNGVYSWSSLTQKLTRAYDFDAASLAPGIRWYIVSGTLYSGCYIMLATNGPYLVGVTGMVMELQKSVSFDESTSVWSIGSKHIGGVSRWTGALSPGTIPANTDASKGRVSANITWNGIGDYDDIHITSVGPTEAGIVLRVCKTNTNVVTVYWQNVTGTAIAVGTRQYVITATTEIS